MNARARSALPTLHSERLVLRRLRMADAKFIRELVNDADWLRFIGDKQVRTLADARRYLRDGPLAMYQRHGFGLCRVERRSDGVVLGMCGLLKRETLADVDVGFAFLPSGRGQGYAREATAAMLAHGFGTLGLARIVAITDPANLASARVLEAAGMRFERMVQLEPGAKTLRLYATGA